MNTRLSGWDDTIIALATPPGIGAIGVIRLSGQQSISIIDQLFPSKKLGEQATHTIHVGLLKLREKILDEVVVSIYKAPRSYTGEDVVEVSCHGSPFIQGEVIAACMEHGARLAKPGEFTQRAFLAGKLDLTQAEAVADLILSNTAAAQNTALNAMRGRFSQTLKDLRDQLITFSALVELELDFATEDVEFADRTQLKTLVEKALQHTQALLRSFKVGNVIKNGVSAAIIGKPNAGKSTLLNALLKDDRAIVSEIAGTTRDTVEEVINIGGIMFRLIDTAGIRSHTADSIENAGIERSRQKMKQSDLIIYLFDVLEMSETELREITMELKTQSVPFILVGNKSDKVSPEDLISRFSNAGQIIFISAQSNEQLKDLEDEMVSTILEDGFQAENVIVTNARHYHALTEVSCALEDVWEGLQNKISGDLLALDIRRCLQYLGEITGEVTNEDQLDYIFSKFCIGK